MELLKVNGRLNIKKLTIGILVPVVGGSIVGWLANRNSQEKYNKLDKPSFSPPAAVFPTVWTILYSAMGVAKYRVDLKNAQKSREIPAIKAYDFQLGLNFLWSFLFFRWGLRGTALVEMTVLLGAIALTTYEFFRVDRTAGSLMVPYIGWVIFALALNYSVWKLNK
ncbi:TspO/MBR family [Bacillus freudenreichii]|nr:TspO/MBR family [Bacillus freudenreichii]